MFVSLPYKRVDGKPRADLFQCDNSVTSCRTRGEGEEKNGVGVRPHPPQEILRAGCPPPAAPTTSLWLWIKVFPAPRHDQRSITAQESLLALFFSGIITSLNSLIAIISLPLPSTLFLAEKNFFCATGPRHTDYGPSFRPRSMSWNPLRSTFVRVARMMPASSDGEATVTRRIYFCTNRPRLCSRETPLGLRERVPD